MGQVNIHLNGRVYQLWCGDGQEEYVHSLSQHIAHHIDDLRRSFGAIKDDELFLMAGLMIADELWESNERLGEADTPAHLKDENEEKAPIEEGFDEDQTIQSQISAVMGGFDQGLHREPDTRPHPGQASQTDAPNQTAVTKMQNRVKTAKIHGQLRQVPENMQYGHPPLREDQPADTRQEPLIDDRRLRYALQQMSAELSRAVEEPPMRRDDRSQHMADDTATQRRGENPAIADTRKEPVFSWPNPQKKPR